MITPYLPPAYDPITRKNTGDMGFRFGGGTKQYEDPNLEYRGYVGALDPADPRNVGWVNFYKNRAPDLSWGLGTAPGTVAAPSYDQVGTPGQTSDGEKRYGAYNPENDPRLAVDYALRRTVYENQRNLSPVPQSLGGGQATQTIGGQRYNVNGNNYAAGTSTAIPRQFQSRPGDAREEVLPAPTGFQFGNNGSLGTMQGQFSSLTPGTSSQFFSQQPQSLNPAPNQLLGTFQTPQDPALKALLQSRSQR